jgi:hypothetical protein
MEEASDGPSQSTQTSGSTSTSLSHLPWSQIPAFRPGEADIHALAAKIDANCRDESVHMLLCDAMLRLQLWRSHDSHFHLEQPQGSELVFQHEMSNIVRPTLRAICDMCAAGKLQHPTSHDLIRKRTQILTTSEIMHRMLETLQCSKEHEHVVIQGSCKPPGKSRMLLSQY